MLRAYFEWSTVRRRAYFVLPRFGVVIWRRRAA